MRRTVIRVPELTGYAGIRFVAVSLPYASQLVDHVKYLEPQDVRQSDDDTERRRQRAPRAPNFRYLVRLALRCDSAEQLGQRLKRRSDRQRQRAGLARLALAAPRSRSPRGSTGCWRRIEAALPHKPPPEHELCPSN
jgi:hypothetical protein